MRRTRSLIVALVVLITMPLAATRASAAVTFGTVTPAALAGSSDYATERFADPWDYENADDQRLDAKAGMLNVTGQRLDQGRLKLTTGTGPSFDTVLTWPGDIAWGRDGVLHPIDAARYTRVSFSMRSSVRTSAVLMWFNCERRDASCDGATFFTIESGWRVYDLELRATDAQANLAWSGSITTFRLIPGNAAGTNIEVDWLRMYRTGPTVAVQWNDSNPGNRVDVYYDSDAEMANNTADNPGWGLVESRPSSAASNTTTFNAAAYPPGTYRFFANDAGTTSPYSDPLVIDAPPRPVVDQPDAAGGADYASAVRGDAWDFSQTSDAARLQNAAAVAFADGTLSATNAGPRPNDPQVELPLAGNIDGSRFHRLSFTYSYDGPFGLEDAPGGGTLARIVWQVTGGGANDYQDLNDVVTYQGSNRVVIDLATNPATAILDEDQVGARLGWVGRQATTLRFDPNEDPGARRWHLDEVKLAEDDSGAGGGFDIVFHDAAWETGTTAELFYDTDAAGFDGTSIARDIAVTDGANTFRWSPTGLAAGRYFVYVALRDPRGTTAGAYSTGPVLMSPVSRLSGADRIATSVAIGDASFAPGAATAAVLARHDAFPDALAGTPLASAKGGPLLLTQPESLDARVESALRRLVPAGRTVYLLGGTGAVSTAVEERVRSLGYTVTRFGGADRYETAVRIAEGVGPTTEVFLTTGTNFPDALGAGAAAGKQRGALVLTNGSSMPPSTAAYLAANPAARRFAVGAPAAQADPGATAISGANRYETCRLVAERFFTAPTAAALASGTNFPDALAGGAHAAKIGAPLLLSPPEGLAATVRDYLAANRASLSGGVLYGGERALSEAVRTSVESAIA